ncbi:MAG: hypothetical protein JWN86_3941 [Planctomycetota bacterium]|nr:hypothetical protein [Planctomycetota bacterium]
MGGDAKRGAKSVDGHGGHAMSRSDELPEYERPEYRVFVRDMRAAGLVVTHYEGRFFYEGPAVSVDGIQDALSNTKVKCRWDSWAAVSSSIPAERGDGSEDSTGGR